MLVADEVSSDEFVALYRNPINSGVSPKLPLNVEEEVAYRIGHSKIQHCRIKYCNKHSNGYSRYELSIWLIESIRLEEAPQKQLGKGDRLKNLEKEWFEKKTKDVGSCGVAIFKGHFGWWKMRSIGVWSLGFDWSDFLILHGIVSVFDF